METTKWRDIDVVVILPDDTYSKDYGDPDQAHNDPKWRAVCRAWMALGREMTGLPIDFKIQAQSHANKEHSGPRSAISFDYRKHKAAVNRTNSTQEVKK